MLRDDRSLMGESDDMKSGVVTEEIVASYLVFVIGHGFIHYGLLLHIVHITCSSMIV